MNEVAPLFPFPAAPKDSLATLALRRLEARGWTRRQVLRRFDGLALTVIALLAAGYWYALGVGDLKDWDEALYGWRALIAHELGGGYWLDQARYAWLGYYSAAFPPLVVWTSALAFKVFGPTAFAQRIFSCACGCGSLFAVYFMVRAVRTRTAALLAAYALTAVFFWVRFARRGQLDVPFICFSLATLAFYAEALFRSQGARRRTMLLWAGVMLGLGLMCKILIAGILAGGTAILFSFYLLATRRRSLKTLLGDAGWMLLPALVIVAPWHIYMTFVGGRDFWHYYIVFHLLDRTTQVLDNHAHPWYYYIGLFWQEVPMAVRAAAGFGLATLHLVVFAGPRRAAGRRFGWFERLGHDDADDEASSDSSEPTAPIRPSDDRAAAVFLLLAAAVPIVLYHLAKTRRDAYFVPMIPGLAILAGVFIGDLLTAVASARESLGALLLFLTFHLWSHAPNQQDNLAVLLFDEPERLFSWYGVDFLLHTVGITLLLAGGIVVAVGLLARFCRPFGRRLPYLAAVAIASIFLYRGYEEGIKTCYDPLKGKRLFGWELARPIIQERLYDSTIFYSNYFTPGESFYLSGGHLYPLPGIEAPQALDPESFEVMLREANDPLVLVDALYWPEFAEWPGFEKEGYVLIHEGQDLFLYARRESRLVRKYGEHHRSSERIFVEDD